MPTSTQLSSASPGSDVPGGEELQINPAAWPSLEDFQPRSRQPNEVPASITNVGEPADGATAAGRPSTPVNDPVRARAGNLAASTAEELRDNWERVKDKLKQRFAELSDDDLSYTPGQAQALIERIGQKTGLPREEIMHALNLPARGY